MHIQAFQFFLKMERQLSPHSVSAYIQDVNLFLKYLEKHSICHLPSAICHTHITGFISWLHERGTSATSQARVLSGLKAFYKYLMREQLVSKSPLDLIESPKIAHKIPYVMTLPEIERMIKQIDLSTTEGKRNRAMLEVLYSCGLRVSELVNLKISNLMFDSEFIKVTGKGNKQRHIPIGSHAIRFIREYMRARKLISIQPFCADFVFLSQRGQPITTVQVFNIIKVLAKSAGLSGEISPHTFRHSFATHLVQNGADLRAVQEMMGHNSIMSTEIYTHMHSKDLLKAIKNFHPRSKKVA